MASKIIFTYVDGAATGITSASETIDFLSVKVGADGLEIKQTGSGGTAVFDFAAKKLTNIAAGTADQHAATYKQLNDGLSGKSDTSHNHDSAYLGIAATATDSDKLDGQHGSYYAQDSLVLKLAGGTMTGDVSMSGDHKLTNLADGSSPGDSVNYGQVQAIAAQGKRCIWWYLFC
jgi:hypothetical protein